ncbi:helix-turn-helix domain-containing protein [Streptomyces sp. DSM 42041]|uniref:Helix-turn-helix domain-containing protein n=1 Tax=Streptomyces hazeniae TaxID=3075538 RepID=A0ABU2NSI8_9ACTN|nr:helix-turn-helix domain-containing protein [Streptomyces sp. DSM 42041]MDT0379705.1 helix-turn-helix domain-containing protein [Streptomyces sp. DSM 42041]
MDEDERRDLAEQAAAEDAVLLDAKGLRALAHPLRVRLVGLLRKHGPSTATRLAERLDINSGSASYHLRRLADAGFVAEDEGRGNGRDRWWQAVHQSTWFESRELAPREPEATMQYLQSVAAANSTQAQRALAELQTMPPVWQEAFDMSQVPLRLTPQEAQQLGSELRELMARYRRDAPGCTEDAPEGAERIVLITQLLPEPDAGTDTP